MRSETLQSVYDISSSSLYSSYRSKHRLTHMFSVLAAKLARSVVL